MPEDNGLGNNLFNEQPAAPKPKKAAAKKIDPEARTWIVLEESTDIPPNGLPISVNGETCMIMAGEPVHIPNKYIEVLDNAVISMPVLDSSERVIGHRQRHRFPYRKVDAPSDAE
jgi:hypothetical protein